MKPFDLAWQLLKANPSWMRRDTHMGKPHTDNLPNPFDPNYQQQLIAEEQKMNAIDEAIERYNKIAQQKMIAAYKNRDYEASNNQTVGLDKIPTTQLYGQRPLPHSIIEEPSEPMPTTLDTNYQRFYSNNS